MRAAIFSLAIVTGATFSASAAAQESHADLAPLTACVGGYAVSIKAGEHIEVIFRQPGEIQWFTLSGGGIEEVTVGLVPMQPSDRPVRSDALVVLLRFGKARRIAYPEWTTSRAGLAEILWYTEKPTVEYALPTTKYGAAVWVASPGFLDRRGERSIFARFQFRDAATRCGTITAR